LELNDSWLSELVPRAEAGENILDTLESLRTPETNEDDSTEDDATEAKIKALTDIICRRGGGDPAAALFVLMGTLEKSSDPEAFAGSAKQAALTHCVEWNVYGMADAQLAVVEGELLASATP
jgi:hypothetical protein